MFTIDREQVSALRAAIKDSSDLRPCIDEVKKMIEIKSAHLWRASAGSCCFGPEFACAIDSELQILENTLRHLESGNVTESVALLEEYEELALKSA